ncbi:hypothetical protein PISMIDRAFT_681658 [Pisolithus microcarpus 441]|uniref:RING-type domain-containing protein n=1 Tax=Pisolithus microcarpus 441 TaxID=765257 RepID=A0A0C9YWF3_9AGAM|nr:hypothetical protein BKA83DRAFT_681658 [Pisolithus microcarpus]KIK21111.1 hypothetical protein PISMIDRAFT_681658 [Pisolithus microcarpus 441]
MVNYPRIPRRLLDCRRALYKLSRDLKRKHSRFKRKFTNYVVPSKGKVKRDPLSENERGQEYQDTWDDIECGCCFSWSPFIRDHLIQCPDGHLFCKFCVTSYASTLLGERNPNIVCMDQSGCKLPFPESELKRLLSSDMLELYERVKQHKEIEAAKLENLEECPSCEYKCVIDNEMEKLFRCGNARCGAVTCRGCKKPEHLPRSCKEAEDRRLHIHHYVEEAMTRALMRNCPNCHIAFIKEQGCNKMVCPYCCTVSCYTCRQIIDGYEHFDRSPQGGKESKCQLWDQSIEKRHAEEVRAAARRAMKGLKIQNPVV